jgi:hypothetical protein
MRFVCNNHIAKQSSQEDDIVKAFDLTGIYVDEDKAKIAIREFLKTLSFNNGVVEVSTNIKPLYRVRPAIHNPETLDYLQKLFDEVTWMDRDRKLKSILGESVRFKVLRFGKF